MLFGRREREKERRLIEYYQEFGRPKPLFPKTAGFDDYKEELANKILEQYNPDSLLECLLDSIKEINEYKNEWNY